MSNGQPFCREEYREDCQSVARLILDVARPVYNLLDSEGKEVVMDSLSLNEGILVQSEDSEKDEVQGFVGACI